MTGYGKVKGLGNATGHGRHGGPGDMGAGRYPLRGNSPNRGSLSRVQMQEHGCGWPTNHLGFFPA